MTHIVPFRTIPIPIPTASHCLLHCRKPINVYTLSCIQTKITKLHQRHYSFPIIIIIIICYYLLLVSPLSVNAVQRSSVTACYDAKNRTCYTHTIQYDVPITMSPFQFPLVAQKLPPFPWDSHPIFISNPKATPI